MRRMARHFQVGGAARRRVVPAPRQRAGTSATSPPSPVHEAGGSIDHDGWRGGCSGTQKEEIRPMNRVEVTDEFETLEATVRRHLMHALALARGNLRESAMLLGVTRWKIARMVKRFELHDFVATMRREREHVTRTPLDPSTTAPASDPGAPSR